MCDASNTQVIGPLVQWPGRKEKKLEDMVAKLEAEIQATAAKTGVHVERNEVETGIRSEVNVSTETTPEMYRRKEAGAVLGKEAS